MKFSISMLLLLVTTIACSFKASEEQANAEGFIKVENQNFVDSQGRQVLLSGINYISKNPKEKYLHPDIDAFAKFKSWGFNCVRLGIIWDGLEPEPGKYNEEYLKELDKRIQWAADNGIYVFLDMHQDLYGAKYSDGAPDWATLDEGKEHVRGAVWSDSYLISPAVQTAFDNFWNNTPAADGVGIQDHYANLWKHIAKRYANNTTVIGYDIMNEPFMGSSAQNVMPLMLGAYAQVYVETTGETPPNAEELGAMWGNEESRMKALDLISTREKYSKVVDAVYELSANFERNQLQPMYQKVANAIREVDMNHILFYNHNYFVNTGVSTALEATTLPDGTRDPNVAYAAHGYDLVVDTKEVENPSYERVEFIFDRIAESGKRMKMPILVGEWGALHGNSPQMVETARHLVDVFEDHQFNNTYWTYYSGIEDNPYFMKAIVKPVPQNIAGDLLRYDYDFSSAEFVCEWKENSTIESPTVLFVPNLKNIAREAISVSPSSEKITFEYFEESNGGKLIIPQAGENVKRTLKVTL